MTPEEAAAKLQQAAQAIPGHELIGRVTNTVEAASKRVTPVDTGTLRRSITNRTLTPYKGLVGTNNNYARYVHEGTRGRAGRPFLRQGLELSASAIDRILKQHGERVLGKVGS